MPASFILTCDHTLVQTTYTDFPCQYNASSILTSYPAIKAMISSASDINVYDIYNSTYIDVYIDLDLSNDKLLIYFSGAINNSSDRSFRVDIGYTSSSNSYTVFSPYYDRFWGMNAADNTSTTDVCLASGAVMTKNTCSFGNASLFYKGGYSGTGNYATANYIPCLQSTTQFTMHFRYKHEDHTGLVGYFIASYYLAHYSYHVNTSGNNLYIAVENGAAQSKWCHISLSSLTIGDFYDIVYKVDLTEALDVNKVKAYINGSQVSVIFDVSWVGLTSTHSGTNNIELLGYSSQTNPSIHDLIAISPSLLSDDFILTSANQYLDSGFWTLSDVSIPSSFSLDVTCNHTLIQTVFTHFPCQINLSSILSTYSYIKDSISSASDINVYDLSVSAYVPVYIDLDLTNNKLLVYFDASINNSADKTFRVTFGMLSSSNSYTVFSPYYDRFWGMNAADNTPTTDVCLASGQALTKNGCSFGNDTLFYKGIKGGSSVYATSTYIPCILSATEFSIHLRLEKLDCSVTGFAWFFKLLTGSGNYINIVTVTSNDLVLQIRNGYGTVLQATFSTGGWVINDFYDIWMVIDLTEALYTDKMKLYVNGYQETLTFTHYGTGLTSTFADTDDIKHFGDTSYANNSIGDSIGVAPNVVSSDFILTSANQYLDSSFWTISNISAGPTSFYSNTTKTFVNNRINFISNVTGTIYLWNFGDGGMSDSQNPKHTYCKAGIYTVTLTIDGTVYSRTDYITVFESSYILDAGAVYINFGEKNQMILGTTEGGNQFGIDQDFRHMTFDTVNSSELVGSHRLTNSVPKIIANFVEINYRLLNIAMPGSDITFNSGSVMIKRAIRKLLNSDYIKNIAIVAEHGGTGCLIVFKILNAVSIESLEIPFEDSKESVIEVTFAGCFSETNYDDEPWEIDTIVYK